MISQRRMDQYLEVEEALDVEAAAAAVVVAVRVLSGLLDAVAAVPAAAAAEEGTERESSRGSWRRKVALCLAISRS